MVSYRRFDIRRCDSKVPGLIRRLRSAVQHLGWQSPRVQLGAISVAAAEELQLALTSRVDASVSQRRTTRSLVSQLLSGSVQLPMKHTTERPNELGARVGRMLAGCAFAGLGVTF